MTEISDEQMEEETRRWLADLDQAREDRHSKIILENSGGMPDIEPWQNLSPAEQAYYRDLAMERRLNQPFRFIVRWRHGIACLILAGALWWEALNLVRHLHP
jgi:hypothetical protein